MTENQAAISAAHKTIVDERAHIDRAAALQRLTENKDFQDIIIIGYLKDTALSKLNNSITTVFTAEDREMFIVAAQATGFLKQYFDNIKNAGRLAESTIEDSRAFISNLQREGE